MFCKEIKTSAFQIIFAEDWLAKLWCGGSVLATMAYLVVRLFPTFEMLGLSLSSAQLVFSILIAGVAAYFASLILGCYFLPPIYRIRERINGAPFQAGDIVKVLKKPHRGRIGRIVDGSNPQYGAFLLLEDSVNESEPLNIPWYSIQALSKNTKSEQAAHGDAEEAV